MKIDVFAHILPVKYWAALEQRLPAASFQPNKAIQETFPALFDLDSRFKIMDKHDDLVQVLTISKPFIERVAEPKVAIELARTGNDELADLVEKYPDRFVAAIGNLPMNDIDAALNEVDRVVNELHFKGIQICTDINGKPLDAPEFMPLYEKMEKYNLPILLHPWRAITIPDYTTEADSKYDIYSIFGWPYDTSAAMIRLVFGHVLQQCPDLKFITHHCGAMIPYFEKRIATFYENREVHHQGKFDHKRGPTKSPIEYLKMFYADTAVNGSTPALMCGHTFFGTDHILFGTDMPYDSQNGQIVVRETIKSIEQMEISDSDKKKIFEDNTRRLLRLSI